MEVFVRGFFHINLGDDLFLYILAKRYPHHNFHVILNSEYKRVFRDQKNIIVHPYKRIRRAADRILAKFGKDYYLEVERECQLNVVIGGSIFQEGKNDTAAYSRLAQMPRFNSTYILGANFGPYITEDYRLCVQNYLSISEDVCFRDKWSKEKFPILPNIRFAPDIVLGISSILREDEESKKQIFISIIDCFQKGGSVRNGAAQYDEFIIQNINHYCSLNYNIILSSFCKMEGDEDAISRIIQMISDDKKSKVLVLNYEEDNWEEIVREIRRSERVIASRFHAMVLGMVFGKLVLPIAYNQKFHQFLDDFGLSHYAISILELSNKNIGEIDYLLLEDIDEVAGSANKHFIKLDGLLLK